MKMLFISAFSEGNFYIVISHICVYFFHVSLYSVLLQKNRIECVLPISVLLSNLSLYQK